MTTGVLATDSTWAVLADWSASALTVGIKSMAAKAKAQTAAGSITSPGKWLLGWSDDSMRWFAIMVISKWW
jgi:hypothetical protein